MKFIYFICLTLFLQNSLYSQTSGRAEDSEGNGLVGVLVVSSANTLTAETDSSGYFRFEQEIPVGSWLTARMAGYAPDSQQLTPSRKILFRLKPAVLKEVEIRAAVGSRDVMSARNTETLTSRDLTKDACCNLSESFENSASVDVNFADAVSGAKTIKLLGLDGTYTQFVTENTPSIRALGNTFGMAYIPGPWMQSIQVNKGAGSVVNGYESITGQINVEYKKPQLSKPMLINAFLNQDMRFEFNLIAASILKKDPRWSSLTAAHTYQNHWIRDMNHDHFIDNPLINQNNLMHRWSFNSGKRFMFVGVFSGTFENRKSGQTNFDFSLSPTEQQAWGLKLQSARAEALIKTGWTFEKNSLGVQYKFTYHKQSGFLGSRTYQAQEYYGYFNMIFQQNLKRENTLVKAGLSMQTDHVSERLDSFNLMRREYVPGTFIEFTASHKKKLNVIGGFRADYHNLYGWFWMPRFNLKWQILRSLSLRVGAGKGYHVPTVFAENFSWLMNFRQITIPSNFKPEIAWNYGASISQNFYIGFRPASWVIDFYRTDFENQLIPNLEDPRKLQFSNLQGKSFSNSFQLEFTVEPLKGFEIKTAYKFDDVRASIDGRLLWWAMKPRHKGLISAEYTVPKENWRFNTHLSWYGLARIPSTELNSPENRRAGYSGNFFLWNAQISWTSRSKIWELYVGAENLLNYRQPNAIIDGHGKPGSEFDASLVWGPLRGAMAYAGFRFTPDFREMK
jgi:outer membrane cobalamin receptor